jgi:fructan beta-fructosidase
MQGGKDSFHYFSGSVVVDKQNTAGFGESSMIAVFTEHKNDNVPEAQALSVSNDGVLFHYYKGNPVLDIGSTSFRDPQVFWHSPTSRWLMVVTHPRKQFVSFYASADLKQWQHLSDFGPMGSYSNDWEVPDLFQLQIDGDRNRKKWVLSIGQGPNKMQYFLGDFDGTKFTPDSQTLAQNKKPEPALWADYGTDFYAARTWRNVDDTADRRTVWLGWMGNWSYAGRVPTSWGKGFESVPREISLKTFPEGIRLVQTPVSELQMLRGKAVNLENEVFRKTTPLAVFRPERNVYELDATFDTKQASVVGFNLLVGEGRKLVVGYDTKKQELFIDRRHCTDFTTDSVFNKTFPQKITAPLALSNGLLQLHILVDQASVEVFANGGQKVMSVTTYPAETQTRIDVLAEGGKTTLIRFRAWELKSIWKEQIKNNVSGLP